MYKHNESRINSNSKFESRIGNGRTGEQIASEILKVNSNYDALDWNESGIVIEKTGAGLIADGIDLALDLDLLRFC